MFVEPGGCGRMYGRLELQPEASAQQIRRAYHRLVHDVHPDLNPEDPDASRRFQEITEAYRLLSSPERRARYDRAHRPPTAPGTGPVRSGGSGSRGHQTVRLGGWAASSLPTVIGTGSAPLGPPPLVVGPVRVAPPARAADDTSDDLSRLVEQIVAWWPTW